MQSAVHELFRSTHDLRAWSWAGVCAEGRQQRVLGRGSEGGQDARLGRRDRVGGFLDERCTRVALEKGVVSGDKEDGSLNYEI